MSAPSFTIARTGVATDGLQPAVGVEAQIMNGPRVADTVIPVSLRGRPDEPGADDERLFESLVVIRAFEENLLDQFQKRGLTGTTHTCIGQEAIAVAAMEHCGEADVVFSNHRSHGHFLAYGGSVEGLLHEIAGHREGVCQGLGGSQHLSFRNFYSNGVLGGTIAVSAGMALAEKLKGTGAIAFCFAGDGVFGEGIVYETLNLASLWSIPLLLIIEDNGYAQTTPHHLNRAGELIDRARAFGIDADEIDSNDVRELRQRIGEAARKVRATGRPFVQIARTYRLSPHSKGDDFRDAQELAQAWERDPLVLSTRGLDPGRASATESAVRQRISAAFDDILGGGFEPLEADAVPDDRGLVPDGSHGQTGFFAGGGEKPPRMLDHLNGVFSGLLEERKDLFLLGEDLLDPYGGAFKVYRGLSEQAPDRVLTTPISEAGIVGLANGMAMRGLRPVVEIMFGDFLGLTMDQFLNHASKFPRMYGQGARCPVVVRTPMGGRRGYGPTHSQSIEKHFFGVPGLLVAAASPAHDQALIWSRILDLGAPTLYLENKTQYAAEMMPFAEGRIGVFHASSTSSYFPTISLQLAPMTAEADCVILTYGGGLEIALEAAKQAFIEEELVVRAVILSQVAPLPTSDIMVALGSCRRVVTLEEGTARWGFGAEAAAALAETGGRSWRIKRCAALDTIIPNAAETEKAVLPQVADVVAAISGLVSGG
jgi:2-oxoisovalerate dehydrogenase E1 component